MKIIVLGAGFAGLQAVKALKNVEAEIIIIDQNSYTTMKPVLPDVISEKINPANANEKIIKLLPKNCKLIIDKVKKIDFNTKKVYTENKINDYNYLVIATGAIYNMIEGEAEIYTLNSLKEACNINMKFKEYISTNEEKNVLIVGTGYTGIEVAYNLSKLAKKYDQKIKTIFVDKCPELMPFLNEEQRNYVKNFLKNEKICLNTTIEKIKEKEVRLSNGDIIQNPFIIYSIGTYFAISELIGDFETINDGRIIVNKNLQIPNHEDVFVVGDAAAIKHKDIYLRKAVNFARNTGSHAANNIINKINKKSLEPFKPIDLGWVLPLGKISVGKSFFLI